MQDTTLAGLASPSNGEITPSRAAGTIPAALAILRLAAALEPDPVEAMAWYRNVPIAVLDGLTAAELVARDRAAAVLGFLRAAIAVDAVDRMRLTGS